VLEYLHSQQPPIIYRDLKPSNIMVTDIGKLILIDFGIARNFMPSAQGTITGTPGYMSPEQWQGMAEPRSDLYSLGATMHHLLTGIDPCTRQPFVFDPVRKIKPSLSSDIEQIIDKLLQRGVDQRYPNASTLKQALLNVTSHAQTPVGPPKPVLQLSANSINFGKLDEGGAMPTKILTISNAGTGNLTWQANTTASFVRLRKVGNQLHVELLPVVGAHTGQIKITSNDGNVTIPIQANVTKRLHQHATRNALIGIVSAIAVFIVLFLVLQGRRPTYGYLKVQGVSPPQIDIYIDAQKVATTPISQPISVETGTHTIKLRNPWTGKTWQEYYDFKKGETYILPVIYGYLKVQAVKPPQVDIYIDDQKVATTPIADPIPVEAGRHTIKLKNPQTGKTWQENHDFREGETYILPEINLEKKVATTLTGKPIKKYGYLKVQKVKPWADIYIDNQKVATTPIDKPLRVDAGIHTIKLENTETQEAWQRRYDFQGGKTYVLPEVDLRTGYLKVRKVKPWAYVYIDNQKVATTPIDKPIRVNTGKHTIKLENPQTGKTWQEYHDFQKGETYVLPEINLR